MLATFELAGPFEVPNRELIPLALRAPEPRVSGLQVEDDHSIHVEGCGWFEVLLTVQWDPSNVDGHRFAHTAIPDDHPLHSEAIEADCWPH